MGLLDSLTLEKPDSFNLTDVLDYTPSILEDSYKQFNSKQNRGIGFRKTVRTDFDDFEGMGKGQIVISDDKEKGMVTRWVPYMGDKWVQEQNDKFVKAEAIMNAPLHLAPLIAPFAARTRPHKTVIHQGNRQVQVGVPQPGGHTLKQRSQLNRYKMQFIKSMENQKIEQATNITPQRGGQIVKDVFSLKRTQPSKGLITQQGRYPKGDNPYLPITDFDKGSILGMDGEPYALESRRKRDQSPKEYSNEFFNQKFDEMGLTDDVKFSLKHMLDSKHMTEYVRRTRKMGIGNPDYSLDDYKKTRQVLVTEFLDGLEAFGIDTKEIEAHHIASLRQVAQLFEGLERHEFPDMIKLIYKHGIFTGNDPNNLVAIPKIGHISDKRYPNIKAVHDYLNKELGLYNEQIAGDWGVLVRDLTVEEREEFVKRFAAVVKGSHRVYEQSIRDSLDELVLRDTGVEGDNPFDDMTYGEQAALDAGRDINEHEVELAKEKIAEYFKLQLTEPNYEALLDSIFGGDSAGEAMRRRGVKPGQPVQGQLIDLGRKPPRKTNKKDNEYPSGPGAYWDIESGP